MGKEMQGVEGDTGWKKAIPRGRNRLQSRVLVGVVGTLLVWLSVQAVLLGYPWNGHFQALTGEAAGISLSFAVLVRLLRAGTTGGAICGGLICFLITFWTGSFRESALRTGLTPLIFLFVLTFVSTRAGRRKKIRAGVAEDKRGRSAAQVLANLSVSALSVSPQTANAIERSIPFYSVSGVAVLWVALTVKVMCLAALVEATADTVSSEMGQAFGGVPVMMVGMRRVAPGTDGAVTLIGSCAGIVAGGLVAVAGAWAMRLNAGAVLAALGAGICGLFFDSLLGATVERRGWLGNDLVNFASTLFAALLAVVVYRFFVL
ncbi:MAG: DUF92 domain-containing protein [Edaphobacter sp.]